MRFKGFIGPSYTAASVNVDCQRCVNLYPEVDPLGNGNEGEVASLVSTPGLTTLLTLPTGPIRGMWNSSTGKVFVVGGQYLYSVASDWSYTQLGQLNTSVGPVSLSDNGLQLILVDGTYGYYVTLSNSTFNVINDPNFLGANQVTYIDGSFVFNKPNSQLFYCSDLASVAFTSALNTGSKEGGPDYLVGLIASQENLYLFGSQTTEVWYDAGSTPCPFARIQGAMLEVGCSAAFSIAKMQNVIYWLGGDATGVGIVYQMSGYQPTRISTPAIEAAIRSAGLSNISGARAWTYQQSGHVFYCLNVPGLNSTWVYDVSTALWHERSYQGIVGGQRHLADCSATAYGVNIVGDYQSANVYSLDSAKFTDNGVPIIRLRAAPHISRDMVRIFHSRFQLDMETGVGLTGTQQGTDPQVMLQWSNDSGHTWSNEHWTGAGKIGKTKARVIWRRLGEARDRVYRVIISDPVKVTLLGAEIDVDMGSA